MIEWFDDVRVGMRFKSPEKLVTREDIKRFAAEFDPQPYILMKLRSSGRHLRASLHLAGTPRRWPCGSRSRRGRLGRAHCWDLAWTSCAGWLLFGPMT